MHWEDLSLRIAELEKQERERRERAKSGGEVRKATEEEDPRRCRVSVLSSRLSSHRNLQLCFINNSDSEEEEGADRKVSMGTGSNGCHAAGLKQEVAAALRALRDKLLEEQKEKERAAGSAAVSRRKHLERCELQELSLQQLSGLKASLQQDVHALSSELVAHLLVRDQLRTKQDAMLLDVQDLT
uniref:schwannomin-interacting protein 1 n=1 Tax=Centroberyx gerrardi TaxID=166262 RepID=UPI003AAAFCBF